MELRIENIHDRKRISEQHRNFVTGCAVAKWIVPRVRACFLRVRT